MSASAMTSQGVHQGPQMAGLDGPNRTIEGMPNAAAMWAGPESLPTKRAAELSNCLTSESGAPERIRNSRNAERSSVAAPMKTGARPEDWSCRAISRKFVAGQVLSGAAATGWRTAVGEGAA